MTDEEITKRINDGYILNFGCNGRNMEVMNLIADMEERGIVKTRDASLSQETRREVILADIPWSEGK